MADGWITIGTELVTDKFDKQIVGLEKKIENEEKKKINIEAQMSTQVQELEEERKKASELGDVYQRINELQDLRNQKKATYGQLTELIGLQQQYGTLEKIGASLDKSVSKQDNIQAKVDRLRQQYDSINDKVAEYGRKISEIKIQKHNADIQGMAKSFDNVGKSVQKSIGKVGKLALGIFGLRSAFIAVRQASSQLANYDKQYAANIEYIRYALTQLIAPVLRWIVSLAYQVLRVINMIINALFGINIFSNASAKNFQKMKAAAGGASKSAKEMKKTLAGFDEMNILQDNKDSGGGGGAKAPDFDLSKLEGETPEWLQWLVDHKDIILALMAGIAAGLLAWKLGMDLIKAIGFGILIAGIVYAIEGLLAYLKDPSWANFGKVITGIGIAIVGLGVMLESLPVVIAGIIVAIVGIIVSNWEKIKTFLQGGIDWLKGQGEFVKKWGGEVGLAVYNNFVDMLQLLLNVVDRVFNDLKKIFDGLIMFIKGVFTGNWKMAFQGLYKILSTIATAMRDLFMSLFNGLMTFVVRVATTVGNVIAGAFKGIINLILGAIEAILNEPINRVNDLVDLVNTIPGVSIGWRLQPFHLPRLAKGGLVNMPGRGTLVGNAVAGERGVEGVIPLTDTQMMEQLGETIGRYITINANIVNKMNGRTISRELKTIQNSQDFAYNL